MSRKSEERRALLLLLLILVGGLGLMVLSREAREKSAGETPRSAAVGESPQGCNAGELDIQEALESGDLLPGVEDARSEETLGRLGSESIQPPSGESGSPDADQTTTESESSDRPGPASSASDSAMEPSGEEAEVRSSQLPLTLLLSPGLAVSGSPGRVRVVGLSEPTGSEAPVETIYSWYSEVLEGPWRLRLDAQVPVGLSLQISFEPAGEGAPPPITGAVKSNFDPSGALELVYQLDRLR